MHENERKRSHHSWMNNNSHVMVATNAYGMGIDKPDVRYVFHKHASKSIENYFQESGRAGRDGLAAKCTIFHSGENDVLLWRQIFNLNHHDAESLKIMNENLEHIFDYCNNSIDCRRAILLNYFGEPYDGCNEIQNACESCAKAYTGNNELDAFDMIDVTEASLQTLVAISNLPSKKSFCETAQILYNNGLRDWTSINIRRLFRKMLMEQFIVKKVSMVNGIAVSKVNVGEKSSVLRNGTAVVNLFLEKGHINRKRSLNQAPGTSKRLIIM